MMEKQQKSSGVRRPYFNRVDPRSFDSGLCYCAFVRRFVSSLEKLPREQRLQKQIGARRRAKIVLYTSTGQESRNSGNASREVPVRSDGRSRHLRRS